MTELVGDSYWVEEGSLLAGPYPGAPTKAAAETKLTAFLDLGVSCFVDLTEETEPLHPYESLLNQLATARRKRVTHLRLPIRDVSVTSYWQMRATLGTIQIALDAGEVVYVHCWGGVGRTGTVVACYLIETGMDPDAVLAQVANLRAATARAHRPSPETSEQEQFVRGWRPATVDSRSVASVPRGGHRTPRDGSEAPDLRARVRGCLLGGAIGDALGAATEFDSIEQIRREHGPAGITDFIPAYGHHAPITDDTQMTLWTAEGLLRANTRMSEKGICHTPSVIDHAYARWLYTQGETCERWAKFDEGFPGAGWLIDVKALHDRRAPGNTCLSATHADKMGTAERPINNSKGCGTVMRIAPVGLVGQAYGGDVFGLGVEVGAITHGHPTGYLASGAFALLIDRIVAGEDLESALDAVEARLHSEQEGAETLNALRYGRRLAANTDPLTPTEIAFLGTGKTADRALAIAVCCALAAEDFRHGVLLAVNHSGDSDSTGSMTGQLLGTLWGEHALPREWSEAVELADTTLALADDLSRLGAGEVRVDRQWWERYPGY